MGGQRYVTSILFVSVDSVSLLVIMIDTPASMDFVNWPPILRGSTEETTELVRKLLHNCLDHHEACRLRDPAGEFNLPSRVLSIEGDTCDVSVKLVENDGLSGRYIALSHCWGSEEKRPLRTTHKNYADHLVLIPLDNLPPLFRDVVALTRSLGIKYLWIDSLCIIQDDQQDWLSEAKKMSLVYRRATLVIAAMDSENSTQRLSKAKRSDSVTGSIPYSTQKGSIQGSFNIAASITDRSMSLEGPLRERGWAFQELYLGRRKIFFTSQGLRWNCSVCGVVERGNWQDLGLYETSSWLYCLDEYSGKHLTYPSDRITALLGIVAKIGESRSDCFLSEFGVWEDQLVEQLLWRQIETRNEDLPGLPSWSWAATGGRKHWRDLDGLHEATVKGAAQSVQLAESGSIGASGVLMRATVAPLPMRKCCVEHYLTRAHAADSSTLASSLEFSVLADYPRQNNVSRFPIFDPNETRQVLGLAFFDRGMCYSGCFYSILAGSRRSFNDLWYLMAPSPPPFFLVFELDHLVLANMAPKLS